MLGVWDMAKGAPLPLETAPGDPPAVIISTKLALLLQLDPGSTLRIRVELPGSRSALPPVDCRVSGIGHFKFEASDDYTVATSRNAKASVIDESTAEI